MDEKKQSPLSDQIFTKNCIVKLNQNWSHLAEDSLLNIQEKISIPITTSSAEKLIFINSQNDTIEFLSSQIHTKNPIILFSPENGPLISNLENFNRLYHFYFSFDEQNIIEKEHPKREIINKVGNPLESNIIPRENTQIEYLKSKKYSMIEIQAKPKKLESQICITLNYRDLYYPILTNQRYLGIRFDNDFWDYTDYYYTNGIGISYINPIFASSPISRILVSNGTNGVDYYGLQIDQQMYTSTKPKVDSILIGDRPWASFSTIGQFAYSFDRKNKIRHYSEFNIGILGPESGGGFLQDLVHTILPNNSPPQGWANQIKTDIIIDYVYDIQKILYETKIFESYIQAGAQAGTLRDHVSWGFGIKYGSFIPLYQDIPNKNYKKNQSTTHKKWRFNLIFDIKTKLIGYDATLQGGVTDRTSIYVIPTTQMNRFVIEGFGGFETSYGIWELQAFQYWKSKEFSTGRDHKYVSIRLNIAL